MEVKIWKTFNKGSSWYDVDVVAISYIFCISNFRLSCLSKITFRTLLSRLYFCKKLGMILVDKKSLIQIWELRRT